MRVVEDGRLVSATEQAFARKAGDGVLEIVIDPARTRYVDVLHEWRHITQFRQTGTGLQDVSRGYRRFVRSGLESDALRYEYRLSSILAKREGLTLSDAYLRETLGRAGAEHRFFHQKFKRSPALQSIMRESFPSVRIPVPVNMPR